MAGYIRESDPTLANSTTIESQAKAVRLYGQKEGYIYDTQLYEYKEAISAYQISYMERPQLLNMLAAAKRREFDVLVVSEVRALSRRQVEVFIIYDMLQKHGVRLETVKEKFEDDAMGRLILSLRAAYAEIEREQSYIRLQRGKKDRIEISNAPNGHPKAAYGYIFVDSDKEVKAGYEFNHAIIYIDAEGTAWTEYTVCLYIFDLLKRRESLRSVANRLNDIGIPPPKKCLKGEPHWTASCLHRIIKNRIYIGEVWANRFKKIGKNTTKRPQEEWILLPEGTAPALIDRETFEAIQEQLKHNKEDSMRNNKHTDEVGLLRAGYIFCGVCGRRMHLVYPGAAAARNGNTPSYFCKQKSGTNQGIIHNHRTQIHMPYIDALAWEKTVTVLKSPEMVRTAVAQRRDENATVINAEDIASTIEKIKKAMQNLYTLAEHAPDDETMAQLTQRMQELGKQKRETEALLYDIADEEEELAEIEAELKKFETWAEQVRPLLTDPTYEASYHEKRLAVRILGIKVTVFPTQGEWSCRYQIDVTVPAIMAKLHCVSSQPSMSSSFAPR